jgi:hypothetical protein
LYSNMNNEISRTNESWETLDEYIERQNWPFIIKGY